MSTSLEVQPATSTSLSNGETHSPSDDFVLVSPSNSFEQRAASLKENTTSASENIASHGEGEVLDKVIALGKENDQLKEILQHNNMVLQQYIKDFTSMQQAHRSKNEIVKREHQRAKEVVKCLREENKALKEDLENAKLKTSQELCKGKMEDLERENAFMKQQVSSLQEHIQAIDAHWNDSEVSKDLSENWQQLLGSLAFYNYRSGISPKNSKSLASEMQDKDRECYRDESIEQTNKELETANEILKVDLEKIKLEKQDIEGKLIEVSKELSKITALQEEFNELKTTCEQLREEKEGIRKMLDDQCEVNLKKERELLAGNQDLQSKIQKLIDLLNTTTEELAKKSKENENLANEQATVREQQKTCEDGKTGNDDYDDIHDLCKEKFSAMQAQYFNLQKQMNSMEERENTLCAKEKEFEQEKHQVEEIRKSMAAELDAHSKSFLEKTGQLHSELRDARDREETLQEQLAEISEREESLQEQVCQLIKENDTMRVKIDKLAHLNSRRDTLYEERMKELEKHRQEKDKESSDIIDMLQDQLGSEKEDRKRFQEQVLVLQNEHGRLKYQHDQLMKEYDELLNSFNSSLEENKMRSSNNDAEIESYKGKLDNWASNYAAVHEACIKKDTMIKDLQGRLGIAETRRDDDVSVLNEQLTAYMEDFREERQARERQQTDLLKLQEENERLVEANRELQRELENLQNNQQMAEMQRRHPSHHGSVHYNPEHFRAGFQTRRGGEPARQQDDWGPEQRHELDESINCPGCRAEFWSFVDIERHMAHCQAAQQRNREPINDNQCPICENEYPDQDTLEIHVQECLCRDNQ